MTVNHWFDSFVTSAMSFMDSSFGQLVLNVAGYCTILVPGFLIIRYVRSSGYLNTAGNGCVPRLVRACVQGDDQTPAADVELGESASSKDQTSSSSSSPHQQRHPSPSHHVERTFVQTCGLISFCAGGLLTSYLVWGLLQERIMTIEYDKEKGDGGETFKNSLFLEFSNRILAVVLAGTILVLGCAGKQPRHTAPIYKYSYCSFSNIMSGWCQYEALKYVSFPIQVLTKASKVIPVMLMGRLVTKQTYTLMEYATAGAISFGVFLFLLSSDDSVRSATTDTSSASLIGVALLGGYLFFDAFTSNWQAQLLRTYKMSSVQMMAGLNLFSVLLTSVSLAEQGGFVEAAAFMTRHPTFIGHIILLACTSAVGQLFIYYTIAQFGPATFVIIMTVRQAIAILLSCIAYHHPVHVLGIVGVIVCFGAILVRAYYGHAHHHKTTPTDQHKPTNVDRKSTTVNGSTK